MRKVIISRTVREGIVELGLFLSQEYSMSQDAVNQRIDRISDFFVSLTAPADYALCRFKKWRELGYHCAAFEGWVFAYEILPEGIVIRDMGHGKLLSDIA